MIRQVILTIAICFGIAYCQTYSAVFHNDFPPSQLPIGVASRTYGLSLSLNPTPEAPIIVNLASTGLQFSPSSLTFTSTSPVLQSFSVTGTALGSQQINVTGGVISSTLSIDVVQRVIYAQRQSSSSSVGKWTNFVSFATSFDDPASDLAIMTNLTSGTTPRILLSNQYTQISNSNRGAYLNVRSDVQGNSNLQFTAVGTRADWYQISSTPTSLSTNQRSISFPPSLASFKVGERVTFQIILSEPSNDSLSVIPAGPGLFFEPATVNFASGSLSASITVYAKFPSASFTSITYTVSGTDAAMYDQGSATHIPVITAPQVSCSPVRMTTAYKQVLHINCRADSFSESFTITPSGEGMTFSPQSVTFSGCTSATFEMIPSVVGSIPIYYDISGDNSYAVFSPTSKSHTITVSKRIVSITGPSVNYAAAENYLMISLYGSDTSALYPPYSSLTLTPCTQSSNLVAFEPSSFTFDNTMSVGAISVRPLVSGVTNIAFDFSLTGDDAYGFEVVPSYSTQIVNNVFDIKYYTDEVHVKQYQGLPALVSTEAFTVNVFNLVANVTLTPESPVVTFTPSSYTFTRTGTTAAFNVTGIRSGTSYVSFKVSGDGAPFFTIPKPSMQITVLGSNAAITVASTFLVLLCAFISL
jgi:hypothetical protein